MTSLKRYIPEFRSNFKLALPIMLGQFGQILVNVVDNIMVGQLGAAPLAAISLAIAVYVIFLISGIGISFALPPLVAEADGAKKHKRITPYFNHSLVINLLYALGSIVLVELIIPVLPYIGHDPEVVKLAIPYLRLSAYTLIPIMIFQTVRCFSEGMSETIPPMIAILAGNILNVFFNYVLIFGKMGMPALGVTGAAIGTLLARILMLVLLVVILFFWKDLWQYIKLQFLTLRRSIFNEVLQDRCAGLPSVVFRSIRVCWRCAFDGHYQQRSSGRTPDRDQSVRCYLSYLQWLGYGMYGASWQQIG